ncbi:DUF4185 domain-containing protein [Mariniluteicoccus flavus]
MGLDRRSFLLAGAGVGAITAVGAVAPQAASAFMPAAARRVRTLTGPAETGRFGAPLTDLAIPVRCPNGSVLYVCGDTFDGGWVGQGNWRSPIGLRSTHRRDGAIDGAVGGNFARGMVPENHAGGNTALPSDVFRIGDRLYMHLMRGRLHATHHSDLWESRDNGETWRYLCQWPGDMLRGAFQQKTYAVANDGWCYVMSSRFNRNTPSELLLHRVRHDRVGDPRAYEPWGWNGRDWGWGHPASTIMPPQAWGEISFRAMSGAYALSWFEPADATIKVKKFPLPTANLHAAPSRTLIVNGHPNMQSGNTITSPYGGFIMPGSTFDNFWFTVSQWNDAIRSYRVFLCKAQGI